MDRIEVADDIEPDPNMDLSGGEWIDGDPDAQVALTVPFTGEELEALERVGHEHGTGAIAAVRRLVAEALEARSKRRVA